MSTSTPTDLQLKDRKKSAHWSDADTDILINILVRHKDAGRTSDNGFKPEVWREAAGMFEGTTFVGGPKTADACKSRWQRVSESQRWQAIPQLGSCSCGCLCTGCRVGIGARARAMR
jgi:ferredoxin